MSPHPIHTTRQMRIICIGAGASGLLFAYKLQRSFEKFSLVIYEKNEEIGGTWYENRYPGCACDIPAHTYTWSFEPKPDWSGVYAGGKEIFDYFNNFSNKYGLGQYVKLKHQVSGAQWNPKNGGWDVRIVDLIHGDTVSDHCDILINAAGILNSWRWPAIPGLDTFKNPLLHSANWDNSVDLAGKHVGLIGNGPVVKRITTFVRGPTWVSPAQGLEGRKYSEEEKLKFAKESLSLLKYRKDIETSLNSQFAIFLSGSQTQIDTRNHMVSQMEGKLQIQYLKDRIIPKWSVGCRRLTPGINYLESLCADNVDTIYGEISEITSRGCVSEGKEYPVDVLICATGFDTSFKPRFPLIGPGGINLQVEWAKEPASYMGIAAPKFPNYLMFLGPNSPIGNGPVLTAIECQADYMLKMVNRWQTEDIYTFSPKVEAVADFIAFKDKFMEKTVWHEECRSWYKNNSVSGKVTALWPGSTLHYLEAMSDVRADDWNLDYNTNRFSWLGNGFSQTEVDRTADWAYYVRESDDSLFLSTEKKLKVINKSGSRSGKGGINLMVKTQV
ncbi:hypothetical protein ACEPPN_012263 [Leptodophora sp. 'Broadleaf-Isolate-01']